MQTFLACPEMRRNARILDRNRLGKQRVEAIQIARALLGLSEGWLTHPAVKMWRGYEPFLIKIYLRSVMDEWIRRGYKNDKCEQHYQELLQYVRDIKPTHPDWFCEELFRSHQSNLVRKKPEYYREFFPEVPHDLPYYWPISE